MKERDALIKRVLDLEEENNYLKEESMSWKTMYYSWGQERAQETSSKENFEDHIARRRILEIIFSNNEPNFFN